MPESLRILLTFDLEEFDLPIEYNQVLSTELQLDISTQGLDRLLILLTELDIRATFFCTAFYAEKRPENIKKIVALNHEIGSHMYYHSNYDPIHIRKSKEKLEEISGTTVSGIRSPRLRALDPLKIKNAGYSYNSSLNPTYLPGRYNNLKAPRTIYTDDHGLRIVPFSVATFFRLPLFWLSFKNINPWLYELLCNRAIKEDGYLHLYFHPWEFADIQDYRIPFYIKNRSGISLLKRLNKFLTSFQKGKNTEFSSISDFLKVYPNTQNREL